MLKINDGDEIREMQISDLIHEFEGEIDYDCSGDIDATEYHLIVSQYAYIKFGLILERVRNQCWWRNCVEKFRDFKQFCQAKVNLSIWQVLNAIKSAQVCVKLVNLGYTELPRNASQALKMSELPEDKLDEVWGNVIKSCEGHKITAHAIESQINPDKEPTTSTIRVPALLGGKIAREAIEYGLTVTEYLEMLVAGKHPAEAPIDDNSHPIDPELKQAVDDLDLKFKKQPAPIAPVKALNQCLDNFNALMENMLGGMIPPVNRRFARE